MHRKGKKKNGINKIAVGQREELCRRPELVDEDSVGHSRVHSSLHFKASLCEVSVTNISIFIHIEIKTNYHNKNFVLRLASKERLRETRGNGLLETEILRLSRCYQTLYSRSRFFKRRLRFS